MSTPYPDEEKDHTKGAQNQHGTLSFSDLSSTPPPIQPTTHIPQNPNFETPKTSEHPETIKKTEIPAIPVFRNPNGNAHTADLAELGAPIEVPPANIEQPATELPKIRFNLSPNFDTFSAHGLQAEKEKSSATTLLGKIALKLKLATIFSGRNLRYAGVGLVSFAVFMLVFNFGTIGVQLCYQTKIDTICSVFGATPPQVATAPVSTPTVTPVASTNAAQPVDSPDVIIIPKLNVNAPIVFEPSIAENAIQNALRNGVVHYAGTALPGEPSNAVIVGHSSNDWWEPGNYKFVFALLEKLEPGDQIQVNYQKKRYVYQVAGKKIVAPTEISVLQPTTDPILTLITCTPPGTSWKRLIITANQIEPSPTRPEQQPQIATAQNTNDAALPGNAPSFFDQLLRMIGLGSRESSSTPSTSPAPSTAPERNYLPEAV